MSINHDQTLLAAGLASGTVVLFSLQKKNVFKELDDIHTSSIIYCKFSNFSDAFVTCDREGNLKITRLSKKLFGTFTDTSFIFGTKMETVIQVNYYSDSGNARLVNDIKYDEIVAVTTNRQTYIIGISPQIKLLSNWKLNEKSSASTSSFCSVHFRWDAANNVLLLDRCWGNTLEEASFIVYLETICYHSSWTLQLHNTNWFQSIRSCWSLPSSIRIVYMTLCSCGSLKTSITCLSTWMN